MHWFDEFSTRLAVAGPSRRTVIVAALGLAASTAWARRGWSFVDDAVAGGVGPTPLIPKKLNGAIPGQKGKPAPRKTPFKPTVETVGRCTFRNDVDSFNIQYANEVTVAGQALRVTQLIQHKTSARSARATPMIQSSIIAEVAYGPQSVARYEYNFEPAVVQANPVVEGTLEVRYGSMVKGLQTASLAFRGGQISGTVNGRAVVAAPMAGNPSIGSLRYPDGSAAPTPQFDPQLKGALQELLTTADAEISASVKARPPKSHTSNIGGSQNTLGAWVTDDCQTCATGCQYQLDGCAFLSCLFTACTTSAGCFGYSAGCIATCFIPGNGCCENPCHPISCCDKNHDCCGEDYCCDSDQACGSVKYGTCCPKTLRCSAATKRGGFAYPPIRYAAQSRTFTHRVAHPTRSVCPTALAARPTFSTKHLRGRSRVAAKGIPSATTYAAAHQQGALRANVSWGHRAGERSVV